jgi:phosphotransacetylase
MSAKQPITSLSELAERVKQTPTPKRVAVVMGQDRPTIQALKQAVTDGFVHPVFIGPEEQIHKVLQIEKLSPGSFEIMAEEEALRAAQRGVAMVKAGQADILMKGLIGTGDFLKAVLDKQDGLLLPEGVLSYVCAIEVERYQKLLFVTDPAVIPDPGLKQKIAMAAYAIAMARRFGIDMPKVALMSASEKMDAKFASHADYHEMCRMAKDKHWAPCIMDGPLDLFLACDPESVRIKGVNTPINGEADVLLFPSLEASNPFYKSLMLFGGGELAGIIQGTTHPVVVMSRSESSKSKYYCMALACLMSNN